MGKNLWGNLEGLASELRYPKEILEEQGEYLRKSSDGLVKCEIFALNLEDTWKRFYNRFGVRSDFSCSFMISSDYVKRYQYEICTVTYGIKVYPVAISFDSGIAEEVAEVFDLVDNDTIIVYDEELLLSVLERILSSREVHQVLGGLMSMAQKERESENMPF